MKCPINKKDCNMLLTNDLYNGKLEWNRGKSESFYKNVCVMYTIRKPCKNKEVVNAYSTGYDKGYEIAKKLHDHFMEMNNLKCTSCGNIPESGLYNGMDQR